MRKKIENEVVYCDCCGRCGGFGDLGLALNKDNNEK